MKGKFHDIVRDHDQLYLRVGFFLQVGANKLTVVTSEPFDKELVGKIAADLGEITLYTAGIDAGRWPAGTANTAFSPEANPRLAHCSPRQEPDGDYVSCRTSRASVPSDEQVLRPSFHRGQPFRSPPARFDREITFGTPLPVVDWNTGQSEAGRRSAAR